MSYSGAGAESVSGVSFTAAPGATIGVIGGTGSGKSTLVNLIPRFYDVTSGRVLVDGMDVHDIRKDELRRPSALCRKGHALQRGTIRSNLLWGNADATEADLRDALKVAQALDGFRQVAGGFDEPVEQGGRNFSGGQRQRLTIARALVRKAGNPDFG